MRDRRFVRAGVSRLSPGTKESVLLREAARLVHLGRCRTLCDALSGLLPHDDIGNLAWWTVKNRYLGYCLPPDGFEVPWGWWRSRSARVIGGLLAAAMAESEGS